MYSVCQFRHLELTKLVISTACTHMTSITHIMYPYTSGLANQFQYNDLIIDYSIVLLGNIEKSGMT